MLGLQQILEIKDLHLDFKIFEGVAKVIEGVDLKIGEKETVALVGESGCGKSSIAHAVLGILPTQARIVRGKILFKGKDILAMNEKERCLWVGNKITFVPQYPMTSLTHAFKVGEQMSDLIRYSGMTKAPLSGYFSRVSIRSQDEDSGVRKKAIEILERVDIPSPAHVMESYPFTLSGGMRQRVLIAMALVLNPVLLIADEPGSALDVTIQDKINRLLMDLVKEAGLSLLYITHDLGVARMLSQRFYIMYAGSIVEVAETNEIFKSPKHPYTVGLMDAIPKLTGVEFRGIDGRIPSYINPPKGCRFQPRCRYATKICKEEKPELRGKNGHWVACHLS